MNVYPVKIEWNGAETIALLKLDLQHIRELAARTGKDILELIFDAPTTLTTMGELLDAALRWKGNENPADLTGDALFEALVEQGKGGMGDWMELVTGIATVSGILQAQQATSMVAGTRAKIGQAIARMQRAVAGGSGEDKDGAETEPDPTAEGPLT